MTARDAAPETGTTDPVVTEADRVADVDSTDDTATTAAAATASTDPSATVEPTESTESTDATPADGDTDPPAAGDAPRGRRGRRRRHAGDDGPERTDAGDTDDGDGSRGGRAGTGRRARWVVTALLVVAVLFAGAMVALYATNRPAPIAGLSSSQQRAVDAATQAAINLQTFRRASFDQDFANALASLTPEFAQQQLAPRKDALKTQLTQGGRDASATALSAGLVSSTSTQAVVLVVTNTTQTADDGTSTPFVFSRLQLTLQLVDGKWLVSDLQSVGLS